MLVNYFEIAKNVSCFFLTPRSLADLKRIGSETKSL